MPAFLKKHIPEERAFQRSLLRWYARHKRDLPWRKNPDPYRILVSEFMLQQTRVETVVPYFERFLIRFPSLLALAKASPQKVLRSWAGLGYYARARNLQKAAKIIQEVHGGRIPRTKKDLLALPGVGPYTAGAVASLAFNEAEAALDGNVQRIFGRLLGMRKEKPSQRQRRFVESAVEGLIPPKRAADFNQALMDLGARVCIPGRPHCAKCPVLTFCSRHGSDAVSTATVTRRFRLERWAVALIEKEGRFLIHRKEGNGLLGGMWQFPTVVCRNGEGYTNDTEGDLHEEKKKLEAAVRRDFGLIIKVKHSLPLQEHQFTHIHASMAPYVSSLLRICQPPDRIKFRWGKPAHFSRYPISRAMGKIADLIGKYSYRREQKTMIFKKAMG